MRRSDIVKENPSPIGIWSLVSFFVEYETPEEIKTAFENYIGYCGSYDLDQTNQKLTFHVKGAWLPNWIGDQIR